MIKQRNMKNTFFIVILFLVGISCFAEEVEATHSGIANAAVGDYIIRSNGQVIILGQGDITYAKRQLGIQTNESSSILPSRQESRAENGDIYGVDNDGDGRSETVFVRGYYRKDGTYVRSHYRARPQR